MRPIILTNSQFETAAKPAVPETVNPTTHSIYLARMEFSLDECKAQLIEVRDVLLVQGATVTDTLVETVKSPGWKFWK